MKIKKESIFVTLDKKLTGKLGIPEERRPICELVGKDGNAYAIMGSVTKALRRAGFKKNKIDEYIARATSGDYNNLLCVTLEYVRDRYTVDEEYATAIEYIQSIND